MTDKYIIAIGGGSIAQKTTLKIDEYVANLAKRRAGERRAVGVFIGAASHDSMPYFNSFRKTYTSEFNIKADCVLSVYGEMDEQKIASKFEKADMIYLGGGDTLFMLEHLKNKGILPQLLNAYERGVIIAGLSAGAICWFKQMYTDSEKFHGGEGYSLCGGLGVLNGLCCPHFNERESDFMQAFLTEKTENEGYLIENDSAVVFKNGEFKEALTSGGHSHFVTRSGEKIQKQLLI